MREYEVWHGDLFLGVFFQHEVDVMCEADSSLTVYCISD